MRRSALRLYAPFLALAVVQAAFIVAAPSKAPDAQQFGALGTGQVGTNGGQVGIGTGAGSGETFAGPDGTVLGADGLPISTNGSNGGTTGATFDGGVTGTGGTGPGGAVAVQGDTRHCTPDGRQHNVVFHAPTCKPKWPKGADNGGATYKGVTKDTITVVDFTCQPNEQVDAILALQGLAATEEQRAAMQAAAYKFINERYEFYGRKLDVKRVIGDCDTTPPDPARNKQAATEVAKMNPFIVSYFAGYAETYDVWARNGIISAGGTNYPQAFYTDRRPFRWDVFMNGDESFEIVAEYYCKKMAKGTATHAGTVIHPQVGGRSTPRKLALILPDNGTGAAPYFAKKFSGLVSQCSGKDVPVFTYESDINRATEQANATVAGLIDAGVTSVVCMCDAIAPVFLTQTMTRNNYYPEHLLGGVGLMDYDKLGRLYDPAQWQHAFGVSQLAQPVAHAESDATKVWRAAGNEGEPCQSCNIYWAYDSLVGSMLQAAGPNLNPLTVEQALVGAKYRRGGWAESRGNNTINLVKFGPGDYTALSDYREVYWDQQAPSALDGGAGAYVNMNGGRRYEQGEIDTSFAVPARPN